MNAQESMECLTASAFSYQKQMQVFQSGLTYHESGTWTFLRMNCHLRKEPLVHITSAVHMD